jgi:hypothetical protein
MIIETFVRQHRRDLVRIGAALFGVLLGGAAFALGMALRPGSGITTTSVADTGATSAVGAPAPSATATAPQGGAPRPQISPSSVGRPSSEQRSATTPATPRKSSGGSTSLLARSDKVPNDIDEYVAFVGGGAGGAGPCGEFASDGTWDGPPTVRVPGNLAGDSRVSASPDRGSMEIGEHGEICLFGFEPGPVDVYIEPPGFGPLKIRTLVQLDEAESTTWGVLPMVGDPLGTYHVSADQGSVESTGDFIVTPATDPVLMVQESLFDNGEHFTVKRGKTLHLAVAGFRPRSTVTLQIFHGLTTRSDTKFVTSTTIHTDAKGSARYDLKTRAADPAGCYAFRTQPDSLIDEFAIAATCLR